MIKLNNLQQPMEVYDAVTSVLQSGRYVKGPLVNEFEAKWAERCNMRYAVALGSGAQALEVALQALLGHVNRGVPISTQSYAFKAVGNAARRMGYNFFTEDEAPTIWTHHLHDQLPNEKPLLEDCSHAHEYHPVADTAIFSFYPAKILGACGEAGILVTNLKEVADRAREIRNHTSPLGTNGRCDEIQAAVLLAKLPYLDEWIKRRKEIVERYDSGLDRKTPGSIFYAYTIPGSEEKRRKLIQSGIESKFYYTPEYMALPLNPYLTNNEVDFIIDEVKKL